LLNVSSEEQIDLLQGWENSYNSSDIYAIREVFKRARDLGIQDFVRNEIEALCRTPTGTLCEVVSLSCYPIADLITLFSARVFVKRINSLAECFGFSVHEIKDWRPLVKNRVERK